MRQFNTSIKKIMNEKKLYGELHNNDPIFLSNWDVPVDIAPYNLLYSSSQLVNEISDIYSYYYWTDEHNYSKFFKKFYIHQFGEDITNFLIGSNGTSSIMLSLIALSELGINRILVFTPVYFSTLNILEMLKLQIFRYDLKFENNFNVVYESLEQYIIQNRIECIFVTDPIFGTGIEHDCNVYIQLNRIAEKYNLWIIIDYIYGGMKWDDNSFLLNSKTYFLIKQMSNTIIIDSITKRLFVNGIKFSIIFAPTNILKKIKRLSIYTTGAMCYQQLNILEKIYDVQKIDAINKIISSNVNKAKNTYQKVCAYLIGKPCLVSESNSSFFFLLGLPKNAHANDMDFAINLLHNSGVLTIPHSRYLLEDDNYYFFRINLFIDENILFEGLSKLFVLTQY